MQALDQCLKNCTNNAIEDLPTDSDRRKPFDPPKGTAFSAVKRAVDGGQGSCQLSKKLESAIFSFAIGENPTCVDNDFAALIEVGVAALSLADQRASGSTRVASPTFASSSVDGISCVIEG